MKNDSGRFGSLAAHPDFKRMVEKGGLRAAAPVPPPLALPFLGKPDKVFARQVAGLSSRLSAIGCRSVTVGLSGGLDSALALLAAHAVFAKNGWDAKGIHVYTLPGFGTTRRTNSNANRLARGLGLGIETIDITPSCRRHLRDIGHDGRTPDVAFENAQARMRTMILMDRANMTGGIVLGTGDMSEIALGWCTFNGDHMSMFGVNAGVPKTVVREVCRWWADGAPAKNSLAAKALYGIIDTPVSPELLPARNGKISQKTEERIGPYELHDFFLEEFVGRNSPAEAVKRRAARRFAGRYGADDISKWLDVFLRRLVSQAFKRNCAPDGVKIYRDVYFSPFDWHIPGDLSWNPERFAEK